MEKSAMFAERWMATGIAVCLLVPALARADEPTALASVAGAVTLANVVDPGPNSPDEPLAGGYSLERGKHFLDSASLAWQKERDCMTCHTNYMYLLVRPSLGAADEAHRSVRQYAEDLVTKRWAEKGPRWDAEVVMSALTLAANDSATSGKLHPVTKVALERMWTVQQAGGGFEWISCDWPPFESDHEFGATMAALAVSIAPDDYAETPAATEGIAKIKAYLGKTPMPTLHHRLMLLWADTYRPGWLSPGERQSLVDQLLSLQHENGGWSAASLGNWQRADGSPQDAKTSDGYATGLAVYLARRAGVSVDDPRLVKGVVWIKSNQRASGRWFTRSLHKDSKHFLTHAGSNMALLALAACDALR
jgi:squalene-hopene/tetraprenyl-beta-curcumene cyclase